VLLLFIMAEYAVQAGHLFLFGTNMVTTGNVLGETAFLGDAWKNPGWIFQGCRSAAISGRSGFWPCIGARWIDRQAGLPCECQDLSRLHFAVPLSCQRLRAAD